MIRTQPFAKRGLHASSHEKFSFGPGDLKLTRAFLKAGRCYFCTSMEASEPVRLGLIRARVCAKCRAPRNIPQIQETTL